jgi:stage V sporulation protein S
MEARLRVPPYRADENEAKLQELKVAATSDAKAVAGAVTLRLRTGNPVRITVMGPSSINQMVKAMAVARTYLEEDRADVAVYTQFVHLRGSEDEAEPERSALQSTLYLTYQHKYDENEATEYKVAATTNPKSTAGAIANGIRSGKPCKLEALGPQAVGQAIKAIAIGRANLEQDDTDIFFVPQFRTMILSNGRRSALELLVLPVAKK